MIIVTWHGLQEVTANDLPLFFFKNFKFHRFHRNSVSTENLNFIWGFKFKTILIAIPRHEVAKRNVQVLWYTIMLHLDPFMEVNHGQLRDWENCVYRITHWADKTYKEVSKNGQLTKIGSSPFLACHKKGNKSRWRLEKRLFSILE